QYSMPILRSGMILPLLFLSLLFSPSSSIDPICSSLCDITHAKEDSCFESTISFFENSLVVSLRNYVDVQSRLQRIRSIYGEPQFTPEQMTQRSIDNMAKAPFRMLEDEVFDLDRAREVLTELTNNVQSISSEVSLPPVECPQGCEKPSTMWMGLFLASLALNLVILIIAVAAILFITSRNEKKARQLLKKSLEREKKKLNEKGRQPIVREISDDEGEIPVKKSTLDPNKWEKKEKREGNENEAFDGERF
ncbi:hypothetical protein PMAYCL1PPCAC_02201, partial [Pristionchus mayeri]